MKIGGVEVNGPANEVLVLPRATSQDIVFTCQAVLDMSQFEAMCPEPKAKAILMAGKRNFEPNLKDPTYIQQCADHASKRFAFIALKSLEPSNIEWDSVSLDKLETWESWEKELQSAGLSTIEVNRVIVAVMRANSLDEDMLEKARASFLRGLEEEQVASSGPSTEPENTQSGDLAKDSE